MTKIRMTAFVLRLHREKSVIRAVIFDRDPLILIGNKGSQEDLYLLDIFTCALGSDPHISNEHLYVKCCYRSARLPSESKFQDSYLYPLIINNVDGLHNVRNILKHH